MIRWLYFFTILNQREPVPLENTASNTTWVSVDFLLAVNVEEFQKKLPLFEHFYCLVENIIPLVINWIKPLVIKNISTNQSF